MDVVSVHLLRQRGVEWVRDMCGERSFSAVGFHHGVCESDIGVGVAWDWTFHVHHIVPVVHSTHLETRNRELLQNNRARYYVPPLPSKISRSINFVIFVRCTKNFYPRNYGRVCWSSNESCL